MSERVLITGGSGFIGTNLLEHYAGLGRQVFNLEASAPRNLQHRREQYPQPSRLPAAATTSVATTSRT